MFKSDRKRNTILTLRLSIYLEMAKEETTKADIAIRLSKDSGYSRTAIYNHINYINSVIAEPSKDMELYNLIKRDSTTKFALLPNGDVKEIDSYIAVNSNNGVYKLKFTDGTIDKVQEMFISNNPVDLINGISEVIKKGYLQLKIDNK